MSVFHYKKLIQVNIIMKLRITITTVVISVVALLFAGCDTGFDAMNENPNASTEAPIENVMPRAQKTSVDRLYSMSGLNGYVGAIWVQHYAKIQYVDEDKYDFSGRISLVNSIWQGFYSRSLEDLNQIIRINAESGVPNDNIEAMARILKAWNFHVLTDVWGDVPYTEALQGMAEEQIFLPKFDTQESIYLALLTELENAANLIDVDGTAIGGSDLIYGSDMGKWQKFANSLRLRIAMRLSEVAPNVAEKEISDIVTSGVPIFEDNTDIAALKYQSYPYNNPVNEFSRTRVDHKISRTSLNWLNDLNDPRLRIYAAPVENEDSVAVSAGGAIEYMGHIYQGVRNGDKDNSLPLGEASTMGPYFVAPSSPGVIMTYSEVEFILAEAAARGWITSDAETHYNAAIRASMEMYSQDNLDAVLSGFPGDLAFSHQNYDAAEFPAGITDAEITGYLNQTEVQFNNAGTLEDQLEQIALQKWLALYGQGLEAWFEWRRFDYPVLTPGPEAVLDDVPVRLAYPVQEKSLNEANVNEAISRLSGTDNMLTPVWWDVD